MKSLVPDPERKIKAELILKRLKLEDAAGLHYGKGMMNQIHPNKIRLKLVVEPGPRPRPLQLVVEPGPRPRRLQLVGPRPRRVQLVVDPRLRPRRLKLIVDPGLLKLEDGHQKRPSPNLSF